MVKEADVPSTTHSSSSKKQGKTEKPFVGNLALKCPKCREMLVGRDWEKNLKVCSRCNYHFKLSAHERIEFLVDAESFVETDGDIVSVDPLSFVSRSQEYAKKLTEERESVGLNEAVVSGHATIEDIPLALAVMDFRFVGGSMASVVGEKITRTIERGIGKGMHVKLPEGAVTSEFVLQHGMIDAIVHRRDLRQTLARLLRFYSKADSSSPEPLQADPLHRQATN